MTPTEALIKNIVTIFVLIWLYRNLENNLASNFSKLIIQFLSILLLMFAFLPIQTVEKISLFQIILAM